MGPAPGRAPRKAVVTLVILGILCIALAAAAQQATQVYRIGWLNAGSPPSGPDPRLDTLRKPCRRRGRRWG
jgi:hypothetical protein